MNGVESRLTQLEHILSWYPIASVNALEMIVQAQKVITRHSRGLLESTVPKISYEVILHRGSFLAQQHSHEMKPTGYGAHCESQPARSDQRRSPP